MHQGDLLCQSEFVEIENWYEVQVLIDSNRVQILVNVLRYRLDLGVQLIFDFEHVMLIILSYEVDCNT